MGNSKTKTPQGKPSGAQKGGTGLKDVNSSPAETNEISNTYLDEQDQPRPDLLKHPNRNTDKGENDQGKDTINI